MNIKSEIEKKFFSKLNDNDYIGVEIEMPLLNNNPPHIIDKNIATSLLTYLISNNFSPYSYDDDNNVIGVRSNETGDTISFEYSYNTVELSLSKSESIYELEKKFNYLYDIISNYFKKYNYSLYCGGINPNYKYINKDCINEGRYKAIERLLLGSNNPKLYNQFCSYVCSVQTHVNISKEKVVDLINMLSMVENIKSEMFSNSYLKELDLNNSRRHLWKISNFGPNNNGENRIYLSTDDFINDYLDRNLFFTVRDGKFVLFNKKQKLKEYFEQNDVLGTDKDNNIYHVIPDIADLEYFRSYKSVEISKYGTLEIRTDCTQPKDKIFNVVAFNVGICKNYEEIMDYIKTHGEISSQKLQDFAISGLKKRNQNEEKILIGGNMKKVGIWMYENDNGINVKKRIVELLKDRNYLVYSDFDMRECFLKDGKVYAKDGFCLSDLDILYHMNADEQNSYQNDILKLLEISGVKVFNTYESFSRSKDKVVANTILRNNGINVPRSYLINNHVDKETLQAIFEEFKTVIIKPRTNHGGKGIIKISDLETFIDFYEATKTYVDNYYIEQYIEFEEHDYRVEIFDGEVVGTYCRGKNGTYKTNISSGGSMEDIYVGDEFVEVAKKAAKALNITSTIIDMILSKEDGKIYVLEVNPIMGIFLEEAMRAGTKMPVQEEIPESFKTDNVKVRKIVNYIDRNIR